MTPRELEVLRVVGELKAELAKENLEELIKGLLEAKKLFDAQLFLHELLDADANEENFLGQDAIAKYRKRIGPKPDKLVVA